MCGHLKKRRPPSIPSVHICTKQSAPCLHFGHGSLRLSYCRRGVSLVNSLLCCGGNSNTGSRKGIRSKRPLPYYGVSLSPPFFFPKTVVILPARSTSRHWVYVGVPTRGPGSRLVNAACFLVPDDDARGNHSNAWFYPGSGYGAVRPAEGVCEGTVLSFTRSACSRGYKQGERGREAPKSLLEMESVETSAQWC